MCLVANELRAHVRIGVLNSNMVSAVHHTEETCQEHLGLLVNVSCTKSICGLEYERGRAFRK